MNKARLVVYRPGQDMERQPKALQAAHRRLQRALDRLFADAERELAGLDGKDRRSKPLRALGKHREGLSVFVAHPAVPMDNNLSNADNRNMPRSDANSLIPLTSTLNLSA